MSDEKLVFIKDANNLKITAKSPTGVIIEDQSVQTLLLFDIRHLLQAVIDGLIDVENSIDRMHTHG